MKNQKKLEMLKEETDNHLELTRKTFTPDFFQNLINISEMVVEKIKKGGKVLLCGNGGSAADCQHFAGEMVNKFKKERKPLPFISLTTDTSIITSIGNDYDFKYVFSKQVKAIGKEKDILICFSTSGRSKNVIEAAKTAKENKMIVISITGKSPNPLEKLADFKIFVPSSQTEKIQQIHLIIYHLLCSLIESEF